MAKAVAVRVCPRCGLPYSYIERRKNGDRVYYYAVHYSRVDGGKRKVHKCYLGPDTYEYVSRLHVREGLILKGLSDPERVLEYLDAIINYIKNIKRSHVIDPELAKQIKAKARFILKLIRELETELVAYAFEKGCSLYG